MIVLDASAVVELLLGTPVGRRVATRIRPLDESLHAPHLLSVEVAQVLRRHARRGWIDPTDAAARLEDLAQLDILHWEHEPLLPRVWHLRENVTAYDAVYLALAEALPAPLLTTDSRLVDVPGVAARVELP